MKKPPLSRRVKEIESELTVGNYEERLKEHQRLIETLTGNLNQEIERRKALEKYLGINIEKQEKYIIKKIK